MRRVLKINRHKKNWKNSLILFNWIDQLNRVLNKKRILSQPILRIVK